VQGSWLGSDPEMAREAYVPAPPASSVTVAAGQRAQVKRRLVKAHAKSRLTQEPLRALRPEDKGQAGACTDRTRAIPYEVRVVTAPGRGWTSRHAHTLATARHPLPDRDESNGDNNSSSQRLTAATGDSA
jgi:hypothetical protein